MPVPRATVCDTVFKLWQPLLRLLRGGLLGFSANGKPVDWWWLATGSATGL